MNARKWPARPSLRLKVRVIARLDVRDINEVPDVLTVLAAYQEGAAGI